MSVKTKPKNNKFYLLLLNIATFLVGFQMALCLYVLSSFLQRWVELERISVFYLLAYVAGLIIILNLHYLIKQLGKSVVALIFFGFGTLAHLGAGFFVGDQASVIFIVWILLSFPLMLTVMDILVENFSKDSVTGTIRGSNLTFKDFGILLGPLVATWVIANLGYQWVFFFAAEITFFAFLIILIWFGKVNHKIKRTVSLPGIVRKLNRKPDVFRIFCMGFVLEIFYVAMVVYTPLYLLAQGFDIESVGKIIFVALVPFIFIQIPAGAIADKKTGEKEWLVAALIIMALFTGMMSFIDSSSLWVWMGLLFMTRVGAALLQVMSTSYFYKQVGPRDVDLIDFFRTAGSLAYVVGMVIFGLLMVVLPLKFIFLILAGIILMGFWPLYNLRDTK